MDLRVSCGENVLGKLSDPRSIQSSHYYSGCPILAAELGISLFYHSQNSKIVRNYHKCYPESDCERFYC